MEYGHFDILNLEYSGGNHSIILEVCFLEIQKVPNRFKEF